MPNCKLCAEYFPVQETVDGKKFRYHSRKYCFTCSPRGQRNTHKLERDLVTGKIVKLRPNYFSGPRTRLVAIGAAVECRECGRSYYYNPNAGHQTEICNSCNANRKRVTVKKKCVEYKGGECERCGYSKCLRALEFHHREPKKKEFSIGTKMSWSWSRLRKELDKCRLLCSNCHCEVHEEEDRARKFGRNS